MRRKAAAAFLAAALGGCTSFQSGPETVGNGAHWGKSYGPPSVPGVKGPYGENVAMAAPYDFAPPGSAFAARQMMNQNIPLNAAQMNNPAGMQGMPAVMPAGALPRGPMLSPPGVPFAPGAPGPNVGGLVPAGGVPTMPMAGGLINANIPPGTMPSGSLLQAQMVQANPAAGMRFQGQRTQIRFVRPSGMRVSWFTQGPDGQPAYSTTPVEAPGRYNFAQAAIYRLKLSNIEGRPGLEVYPTMEVVPCNPKTEAFLAHSAVPISFTNDDFKQIAEGNYLVKVIYLPDPQFQDVAGTGTDEILSTRLDPGADPIQEALRRGSILVVLRMGNVDQEAPNTPPLNAPAPHAGGAMAPGTLARQGAGAMPPTNLPAPFGGMKTAMPGMAPPGYGGQLPASVSAASRPMTGAAETPKAPPPAVPAAPGTSSTYKSPYNVPMAPGIAPVPPVAAPARTLTAPPPLPLNYGPAFPPMPANIQ